MSKKKEIYEEVDNTYFDEFRNVHYIDAWKPNTDEGQGVVTINPDTFEVTYIVEEAKQSAMVHKAIKEVLEKILGIV